MAWLTKGLRVLKVIRAAKPEGYDVVVLDFMLEEPPAGLTTPQRAAAFRAIMLLPVPDLFFFSRRESFSLVRYEII